MALNKVEICGLDTSKLPKITQSESMELLSRIKAGDNAARVTEQSFQTRIFGECQP